MSIKIANLLLTRKCNLKCSYCRISGNMEYEDRPLSYPDRNHYFTHERDTEYWIKCIDKLYNHNKDIFLILYGGEIFLRDDVDIIVNHCNDIGVNYTIISSCNTAIQPRIEEFFKKVEYVKGFSASIDPGAHNGDASIDAILKSQCGFHMLKSLISRNLVKDPVAEITVSSTNIHYLVDTVERLSYNGITSSITYIEPAKNEWYDFSSVSDSNLLVQKSHDTYNTIRALVDSNYKIHMKDELLLETYKYLPADMMDCGIDEKLHNITIDSDGRLRLCLRIRSEILSKIDSMDLLDEEGTINESVFNLYKLDKRSCCEGCIWTCPIMSRFDSSGIINH